MTTSSALFQDEDEVPDDETLNQMIARNEDEFDLFMVRNSFTFTEMSFCETLMICQL